MAIRKEVKENAKELRGKYCSRTKQLKERKKVDKIRKYKKRK